MATKYKKYIKLLLFILSGCMLGYIYYKFIGCYNTWSITSSALRSTIYGGIIGGLLSGLFTKK